MVAEDNDHLELKTQIEDLDVLQSIANEAATKLNSENIDNGTTSLDISTVSESKQNLGFMRDLINDIAMKIGNLNLFLSIHALKVFVTLLFLLGPNQFLLNCMVASLPFRFVSVNFFNSISFPFPLKVNESFNDMIFPFLLT